MNKILEQMKATAWKYADQNTQDGDGNFGRFQLDKFAELIILECMRIANTERTAMEIERGTQLTADAIKKHFGV
jgi:hypothetical protein